MANNPCMGCIDCPYCGHKNIIIWNGNFKNQCQRCGKKFMVKRQKLKDTKRIYV